MAVYLMYGKYNPGSLKEISAGRTEKAKELIQKNGGTVKSGYALLGVADLLFIVEFPSMENVAKTSVDMGNIFGISFSTTPAITIDEFDKLF